MEDLELHLVDDDMMPLIVRGRFFDGVPEDDDGCDEMVDVPGYKEEPGSLDDRGAEAAKVDEADSGDEAGDPAKLRRKQKNRDAAVRSRERKKMYVKDLEVKSKYLEGQNRSLRRLLQCVMAENQALRFSLQNSACGANVAKQESAVLSAVLQNPATGFPVLVPMHHMPVYPTNAAPAGTGSSVVGKRRKGKSESSGSKRNKK